MNKIIKLIKAKLSIRTVSLIVLISLSIYTTWKVHSFFSYQDSDEETTFQKISPDNSIDELSSLFYLKDNDNLFTPGVPVINNALFVNPENKTLMFKSALQDKPLIIGYDDINSHILKVKIGFEKIFDDFIKAHLRIPNYSQLLNESNNLQVSEIMPIAISIGADSIYAQQLLKTKSDIRTTILSLIYDAVLSGGEGHIATAIENNKIIKITDEKYTTDQVNINLLAEAITKFKIDADDRARFIEREYNKLHPREEITDIVESPENLQVRVNKLFGAKTIVLDTRVPFDFVYVDLKHNTFYCGDKSYPYNSNSFYANDIGSFDLLFAKQFSLANYKSLSANEIANNIGIPFDSTEASAGISNQQKVFKELIEYLINNPSIYCILNGKLNPIFNVKGDSILYGKFNAPLLQKGIYNLNQNIPTDLNKYTIAKKENLIPAIIYIAIFFLFFSCCVVFFLYHKSKLAFGQTDSASLGDIEQLEIRKDKSEKLLVTSNENIVNKTVNEITRYLTKWGEDLDYETPALKEIRHKMVFYDIIEKSKNSVNLVKVLEAERKLNEKIPKIESANDIFEEANRSSSSEGKIIFLLTKFDEYSTELRKDNQKLFDKFQNYEKVKQNNDKLNTLLAENCQRDFYSYLKEQIEKVENNPSIESFVQFGSLFKSSGEKKFKSENEILKDYNDINNFINEFYRKYQRIAETKLLERTALLCWSLELANDLLQIKKVQVSFDFEKVKQDQLQLISTRYFIHNAKDKNKTLDDFELSIIEGNERIAEYNRKIADPIAALKIENEYSEYINMLKSLMRKIKKYETSELFFKMLYEQFIRDFLDRVENLKFNEKEVSPEDRSWLFQQLFNIAFHTADYAEYFVKEDDINYHPNYIFLKNNLDLSRTEYRPFVEDNIAQSTRASNIVVKAARFAGVKKLDLLINKYYIKPEQLS